MQVGAGDAADELAVLSSMKCIRFDVCKAFELVVSGACHDSSMKCIRFDVCKFHDLRHCFTESRILNEVHTF